VPRFQFRLGNLQKARRIRRRYETFSHGLGEGADHSRPVFILAYFLSAAATAPATSRLLLRNRRNLSIEFPPGALPADQAQRRSTRACPEILRDSEQLIERSDVPLRWELQIPGKEARTSAQGINTAAATCSHQRST